MTQTIIYTLLAIISAIGIATIILILKEYSNKRNHRKREKEVAKLHNKIKEKTIEGIEKLINQNEKE